MVSTQVVAFLSLLATAAAEQLPIRTFRTADGLAHESVHRIIRDSHGFLWFATSEGLSRFDGYEFTNYDVQQGLPDSAVNDIVETQAGVYWLATSSGLCRFQPAAAANLSRCTMLRPNGGPGSSVVYALLQDSGNSLWLGTANGAYHYDGTSFRAVDLGIQQRSAEVRGLLKDRRGFLWLATTDGLIRLSRDGHTARFCAQQGLAGNEAISLLEDHSGRMWVGTLKGLSRLVANPERGRNIVDVAYTKSNGLAGNEVLALAEVKGGVIWIATTDGLSECRRDSAGGCQSLRAYTTANGLSDNRIEAVLDDGEGDLWLASDGGGVMRFSRGGFRSFTEADGLASTQIASLLLDRDGALWAVSRVGSSLVMNRFDGNRFRQSSTPKGAHLDWGSNQIALQDHLGDWWIASDIGLLRLDRHSLRLKTLYTTLDGLDGDRIFRVFEDSRGDVWTSSMLQRGNGLTRWERSSGTFQRYSVADGLLPLRVNVVDAIAEDHAGNLWFGFFQGGGLLRYRGGRFTAFGARNGVPPSSIRSLYCSRSGQIWAASNHRGLVRIDDPAAERPNFTTYTTDHGLSSNQIHSITEDAKGRIYVGTGRGVDCLDPSAPGAMRLQHYTTSDGLTPGELHLAVRDSQGAIWFGTAHGLSRLLPEPSHAAPAPNVTLQALRIAGVPYAISELGASAIDGLTLAPYQNQIQVDFVAVTFASPASVRYRYKLEGADREWSAPTSVRSVKFAKLSPGRYRFLVQSVNSEGFTSALPAVVSFVLLPPFWQRWWFLTVVALSTAALVSTVYRFRVSHLLELERIRTRIATDLHDDIGASLSQIAILSEVAQHRSGQSGVEQSLERIGGISRELVDSMGDIVWAIQPHKDRLRDLRQRMRRFAADVLSARNIEMRWHAEDSEPNVELGPELRRQLYLLFKETVNNIARHSGASQAVIDLHIEHGWLTLGVTDNGAGFDLSRVSDGHGLRSMKLRGAQLGGSFEIRSAPGNGTTVSLRVRIRDRRAQ